MSVIVHRPYLPAGLTIAGSSSDAGDVSTANVTFVFVYEAPTQGADAMPASCDACGNMNCQIKSGLKKLWNGAAGDREGNGPQSQFLSAVEKVRVCAVSALIVSTES